MTESYIIGTINLFAGTFVPEEFLECNGAALDPVQYQVLFNVIGTKFGGDGVTAFNLPTLAPPVAGVIYMICLNGAYPEMPRGLEGGGDGDGDGEGVPLLMQMQMRRLR